MKEICGTCMGTGWVPVDKYSTELKRCPKCRSIIQLEDELMELNRDLNNLIAQKEQFLNRLKIHNNDMKELIDMTTEQINSKITDNVTHCKNCAHSEPVGTTNDVTYYCSLLGTNFGKNGYCSFAKPMSKE